MCVYIYICYNKKGYTLNKMKLSHASVFPHPTFFYKCHFSFDIKYRGNPTHTHTQWYVTFWLDCKWFSIRFTKKKNTILNEFELFPFSFFCEFLFFSFACQNEGSKCIKFKWFCQREEWNTKMCVYVCVYDLALESKVKVVLSVQYP